MEKSKKNDGKIEISKNRNLHTKKLSGNVHFLPFIFPFVCKYSGKLLVIFLK